jgi:predicted metal-dependent phosphoesterase TrpH
MELYTENRLTDPTLWKGVKAYPKNGVLQFTYTFEEEQEWTILVIPSSERKVPSPCVELHVYSLKDDLYYLNPYMGDLHSHSNGSDGKEDPAIVAANHRKAGFDFFALTDHHKWYPSAQMLKAYEGVPLGIKLFNGEEVHVPSGWIHIVNFGSKYSVCEMYEKNKEEFTAQVEAQAAELDLPSAINPLEYAWRRWGTNEIRKAGGLAIVAHPYWIYKQTYHMSSAMLDYVFETGIYDAFELVGGQSVHENNVQNAFYQEQRAKGRNIPIVGSSDSHGTDPASYFGLGKTVVFAKDRELSSICEAIKNGYSAAIEQQYGEEERVYGTYRMVKYTRFLLDRYFPAHDELCAEEGMLMREYVLGNEDARNRLATLCDRTEKHMKKLLRAEE